jgi:DNA-binding YbaB/EbfC family protein
VPDADVTFQDIVDRVSGVCPQMLAAQAHLATTEVTGHAGDGLVIVTMRGSGDVVGIRFDRSVMDSGDADALADLTMTAIRRANDAVTAITAERMGVTRESLEAFMRYPAGALNPLPVTR